MDTARHTISGCSRHDEEPRRNTTAANHAIIRLGWGVLCVAGGGAYYFAKRSINADRASRHEADMKRKARFQNLEPVAPVDSSPRTKRKKSPANGEGQDHVGSPSAEASEDAAPVGHAPETEQQQIRERSKYEAAEPYRSRKGDRFS